MVNTIIGSMLCGLSLYSFGSLFMILRRKPER